MCKSKSKIKNKDVFIFFLSSLLVGLIKVPFVLLSLLIYLVPKENFNSKNTFILSRTLPIVAIFIAFIYSYGYASGQLENTERKVYFIENNVSSSGQIDFILNNPLNATVTFLQLGKTLPYMAREIFTFSHMSWIYASSLLSFLYPIFFSIIAFFYKIDINFKKIDRIKIAIIIGLIYVGTYVIQYISWTPVGFSVIDGVYGRYFIPILLLIPLIINLPNHSFKNSFNKDLMIITSVIIFLAAVLILTISYFY